MIKASSFDDAYSVTRWAVFTTAGAMSFMNVSASMSGAVSTTSLNVGISGILHQRKIPERRGQCPVAHAMGDQVNPLGPGLLGNFDKKVKQVRARPRTRYSRPPCIPGFPPARAN